jgi:hypothetical protein
MRWDARKAMAVSARTCRAVVTLAGAQGTIIPKSTGARCRALRGQRRYAQGDASTRRRIGGEGGVHARKRSSFCIMQRRGRGDHRVDMGMFRRVYEPDLLKKDWDGTAI